jgi:hypothetical protein
MSLSKEEKYVFQMFRKLFVLKNITFMTRSLVFLHQPVCPNKIIYCKLWQFGEACYHFGMSHPVVWYRETIIVKPADDILKAEE